MSFFNCYFLNYNGAILAPRIGERESYLELVYLIVALSFQTLKLLV